LPDPQEHFGNRVLSEDEGEENEDEEAIVK